MTESAALLVDTVLPHQPMRQWVLSIPYENDSTYGSGDADTTIWKQFKFEHTFPHDFS